MVFILEQYLSSVVLFILAVITIIGFMAINKFLAPKRKIVNQFEGISAFVAYECGELPVGSGQQRFSFQYYVFALVFVVFDVVSSLLVAWALILNGAGANKTDIFVVAFVFLGIIFAGFLYWWKRNALRWM